MLSQFFVLSLGMLIYLSLSLRYEDLVIINLLNMINFAIHRSVLNNKSILYF